MRGSFPRSGLVSELVTLLCMFRIAVACPYKRTMLSEYFFMRVSKRLRRWIGVLLIAIREEPIRQYGNAGNPRRTYRVACPFMKWNTARDAKSM